VGLIYGSLPPDTRRGQAALFNRQGWGWEGGCVAPAGRPLCPPPCPLGEGAAGSLIMLRRGVAGVASRAHGNAAQRVPTPVCSRRKAAIRLLISVPLRKSVVVVVVPPCVLAATPDALLPPHPQPPPRPARRTPSAPRQWCVGRGCGLRGAGGL
jgi:hypothetical protein